MNKLEFGLGNFDNISHEKIFSGNFNSILVLAICL